MINYNAYSDMLTEQVDMCFPFENIYFQKNAINKLANISEIGCGNGSFLRKLNDYYPGPNYKGYDLCEPLIEVAKSNKNSNLSFEIGSVNCLNADQDLIILRLIIHQLQDRREFIKTLSSQLKSNSQVIIIDPYDEMFHISMHLPSFNKHLIEHRKIFSPSIDNRNVKLFIEAEMKEFNFSLQEQFYYYVPSLLPGYKEKYYNYMKSTCLITECEHEVLKEIDLWYADPSSSVQIGLIFFKFLKQESS